MMIRRKVIPLQLGRMAALPGWKSAYDLLPGRRLKHYA
jgi:glutathione S-transferase